MATNYLDTVTMYHECKIDLIPLFINHWLHDTSNKDKNLHHYCIKTEHCFVRYFPNMYGYRRLYATFSLPKMYHQSGNNAFNLENYDNLTFLQRLETELALVIPTATLPTALSDWQPSRIDLFYMRKINPADRKEYHHGYGRLMYRGITSMTYLNTNYLASSKSAKRVGVLCRMYDKSKEICDRHIIARGGIPPMIEDAHEFLMGELDMPEDYFRYEFANIRPAIKRQVEKYHKPLNMETIMDEAFQKRWLNDLIYSRGLHCHILCKKEYRKAVDMLFHWQSTRDNAVKLAEAIRNKRPLPLTKNQRYRIQSVLKKSGISIATTDFISIEGLDFLN